MAAQPMDRVSGKTRNPGPSKPKGADRGAQTNAPRLAAPPLHYVLSMSLALVVSVSSLFFLSPSLLLIFLLPLFHFFVNLSYFFMRSSSPYSTPLFSSDASDGYKGQAHFNLLVIRPSLSFCGNAAAIICLGRLPACNFFFLFRFSLNCLPACRADQACG